MSKLSFEEMVLTASLQMDNIREKTKQIMKILFDDIESYEDNREFFFNSSLSLMHAFSNFILIEFKHSCDEEDENAKKSMLLIFEKLINEICRKLNKHALDRITNSLNNEVVSH